MLLSILTGEISTVMNQADVYSAGLSNAKGHCNLTGLVRYDKLGKNANFAEYILID